MEKRAGKPCFQRGQRGVSIRLRESEYERREGAMPGPFLSDFRLSGAGGV